MTIPVDIRLDVCSEPARVTRLMIRGDAVAFALPISADERRGDIVLSGFSKRAFHAPAGHAMARAWKRPSDLRLYYADARIRGVLRPACGPGLRFGNQVGRSPLARCL